MVTSVAHTSNVGTRPGEEPVRIFLSGDVMTGRGVDQVLPHPCPARLYESYVKSANRYVRLAEEANGIILRPLDFAEIWGDAIDELNRFAPDVRIVNLETSITLSEDYEPKGINYRMSPQNAGCLSAARIDCCVLANNHVLDWGRAGLLDTLRTLQHLQIKIAGAGQDLAQATSPAALDIAGKGRVLVFAFASVTSGTPRKWAATQRVAGVNLLGDLSDETAADISARVARVRKPGDVIVVSLHWGPNWGYEIPDEQRRFAHALVDQADVSIVHGHSSHHAKAIEVYRNRLILYGCGDFLNDYEGISGKEEFRDDLPLMFFAAVSPSTRGLVALEIVPFQIRRFRLVRPSRQDIDWLRGVLDRESQRVGARVVAASDRRFSLAWASAGRRQGALSG